MALHLKRTVNILLLSNMYPDKEHPFYGIFVKNIVENLKKTPMFEVELISKKKSKKKIKSWVEYVSFYLTSIRNIIVQRYDVVYLHYFILSFPPVLLGKLITNIFGLNNNIKIVVHIHGSDLRAESSINKLLLTILKPFTKTVDAWVVPSRYFLSVLEDYLENKEAPILIYPSGGVDTQLFKPIKKKLARRKFRLDEKDFVVGWVSRIDRNKGWEIFLKALYKAKASIPNIKAIVAGGGNDENQFKKTVHTLGLENNIIILGNVNHEQLPFVYNAMDIFAFPSMKESLGLVGLEALACGIPVIASDIEGPKEYIEENVNGFLFKPGSAESLYKKIAIFYNLPDKNKEELKRRARETALKYDSCRVNQELVKFLMEVSYEDNRDP